MNDMNDAHHGFEALAAMGEAPVIRHGAAQAPGLPALKVPVTHYAAERIQRMILDGAWGVGERLPGERQLSEQLGVSRVSLRHALALLETLGFIAIEPGRGAFVQPEDQRRTQARWKLAGRYAGDEVFAARSMLNGWAAGLLARRISASQSHALAGALAEMREAAQRGDAAGVNEWDMRFHDMLFEFSGNQLLADLSRTLHKERSDSSHLAAGDPASIRALIAEHESVLQALGMRDAAQAKAAVERHLLAEAQRAGCTIDIPWAAAA
jgi:GntR family transcriptional regulator, transcriptional repressor for pyruvate dehydrogenase complex